MSREEIFTLLKGNLNENAAVAYEKIEDHLSKKLERPFILSGNAKSVILKLLYKLKTKWQEVKRIEQKFLEKNQQWLNVIVYLDENKEDESQTTSSSDKGHMGRPKPEFAQCSERTKRRRTENIRQSSFEELSYATHMKLRAEGKVEAAKIVKDISSSSPSKAKKYRSSLELIPEVTLSADEAVSLIMEQKLSRSQYQGLRNLSVKKKCKLYPSYKLVLKAKRDCYPEKNSISICETSAEVKLQSLLNHTINRILKIQMDVIKTLTREQLSNLNLICKWGCDGSSGLSMYKQKFSDDDESKSDASIFFTSLVPLQLISIDKNTSEKIIVWKNPRPSSPRFCRPIKIEFLHETTEATVKQTENIKEQASKLIPFNTVLDGKDITVNYELALTMIDGKVCNAITGTASTQRCYLCNATSKDFNNIDLI